MDKLPIDLELETGVDGKITLVGQDIGEPEKSLIVERAMELAAIESRPDRPTRGDFENAARELSADSEYMDRGARDIADVAEKDQDAEASDARDYAEVQGDGNRQIEEDEATDEASVPDRLVERGLEDASNEQMLEGRKKHGVHKD